MTNVPDKGQVNTETTMDGRAVHTNEDTVGHRAPIWILGRTIDAYTVLLLGSYLSNDGHIIIVIVVVVVVIAI